MTEYLASVPVVATRSVEEAREAVSRIYLRHNLASRDGAMNMRLLERTPRRPTANIVVPNPSFADYSRPSKMAFSALRAWHTSCLRRFDHRGD
jgi:hypothetical protein